MRVFFFMCLRALIVLIKLHAKTPCLSHLARENTTHKRKARIEPRGLAHRATLATRRAAAASLP